MLLCHPWTVHLLLSSPISLSWAPGLEVGCAPGPLCGSNRGPLLLPSSQGCSSSFHLRGIMRQHGFPALLAASLLATAIALAAAAEVGVSADARELAGALVSRPSGTCDGCCFCPPVLSVKTNAAAVQLLEPEQQAGAYKALPQAPPEKPEDREAAHAATEAWAERWVGWELRDRNILRVPLASLRQRWLAGCPAGCCLPSVMHMPCPPTPPRPTLTPPHVLCSSLLK